jgi:hypothetical protein
MATLGSLFAGISLSMRGGEKKKEQGPPINASSGEEEQFIQYAVPFVSRQYRHMSAWCYTQIQEIIEQYDDANQRFTFIQGLP